MKATDKIWMSGELVDWADAKVHIGVHGLHYGTGVFEGIRCYETADGPAVFRLTDHLSRLHNSARLIEMKVPVVGRGAPGGVQRADRRERPARVLPAPGRVLRLRRAGRAAAQLPGRGLDHQLAVGDVPRRGRARERHPRQDLDLGAHRPERDPARLQGDRDLPELAARGAGGRGGRLRRGDPAHARGLRRRRLRREHLHREERPDRDAGPLRRRSSRASRATRSSRSPRTSATRSRRRT